jgi:hypothetical protein
MLCSLLQIESCCERRALLEQRLQQLMRMHVVNDAFHIWYSGPFVTINGFRVGRLTQLLVSELQCLHTCSATVHIQMSTE